MNFDCPDFSTDDLVKLGKAMEDTGLTFLEIIDMPELYIDALLEAGADSIAMEEETWQLAAEQVREAEKAKVLASTEQAEEAIAN